VLAGLFLWPALLVPAINAERTTIFLVLFPLAYALVGGFVFNTFLVFFAFGRAFLTFMRHDSPHYRDLDKQNIAVNGHTDLQRPVGTA
jgi:hypothetical protein